MPRAQSLSVRALDAGGGETIGGVGAIPMKWYGFTWEEYQAHFDLTKHVRVVQSGVGTWDCMECKEMAQFVDSTYWSI